MTKYGNKEVEDKRALYNNTDDMGQVFDKDMVWTIPQQKEPDNKPVTREEVLDYINKRMDSHIFIERNCSSLMNEDQILRLSKIKEYIGEHLK